MDFWRKFLNVAFWFLFALCATSVFIYAIILFCNDEPGFGSLVLFGGGLALVMSFALSGTFLELCNNIAEMNSKMNSTSWSSRNQSQTTSNSNFNSSSALQRLQSVSNNNPNEGLWYCKDCGTANDKLDSYCKGCGKYK